MPDPTQHGQRNPIPRAEIPSALVGKVLVYEDGSEQTFTRDGRTEYVERGVVTNGEWGVNDDGTFWSFWPPDYLARYQLFRHTDADGHGGVQFVETRSQSTFVGTYHAELVPPGEQSDH